MVVIKFMNIRVYKIRKIYENRENITSLEKIICLCSYWDPELLSNLKAFKLHSFGYNGTMSGQ